MNPSSSTPERSRNCQGDTLEPGLAPQKSLQSDAVQHHDDESHVPSLLQGRHYGQLSLPKSTREKTVSVENGNIGTEMSPEGVAELPTPIEQALPKYGKIVTLQDRYLIDQTRLKSERDAAVAEFHSLKESIAQFLQLLETNEGQITGFSSLKSLRRAYDQIVADGKAFDDQMSSVIKQEQALGELEYRLGRLLPDLLDVVGSCFPDFERSTRKTPLRDQSRDSSPPSPTLEPIEDDYYNKRGDVRLLRDLLFNHISEAEPPFQSSMANAFASASTQANPPTQTAEESALQNQQAAYQAHWQSEHDRLQKNLSEEEKELKRLWEACQNAGIDVGELSIELTATPRLSARSPPIEVDDEPVELHAPPFLSLEPGGVVSRFLKDFHWPERGAFVPFTLPNFTNLAEKRDFIERWVVKLPDTIFGSHWTEFDHTVTDSQQDLEWMNVHKLDQTRASLKDYAARSTQDFTRPSGESSRQGDPRRRLRHWRSDEALTSLHTSKNNGENRP